MFGGEGIGGDALLEGESLGGGSGGGLSFSLLLDFALDFGLGFIGERLVSERAHDGGDGGFLML